MRPPPGGPLSSLRSLRWFECGHGQLSRNLIEIVDLARVGLGFFQAVSYGEELPDDSFSSGPVLPARRCMLGKSSSNRDDLLCLPNLPVPTVGMPVPSWLR